MECIRSSHQILTDRYGRIGWGQNSGFQALNMAVQFGASKILLVGFDCSLKDGTHHHGRHPAPLTNPRQASVDKWRGHLEAQVPIFDALGIEVVNCSPTSTVRGYRKCELVDAIKECSDAYVLSE